jgi:large repetitive protein
MATRPSPRGGIGAAALVLLLAGCGQDDLPTAGSHPATSSVVADVVVSNTDDDGPGSLRQALLDVPLNGVIGFEPALAGARIVLASRLEIDGSFTIEGPANGGIILDGDGVTGVLLVLPTSELTLRNVTVTGGYASSGGIFVLGFLRVENSTITGNRAVEMGSAGDGFGGGINLGNGSLIVVNSTISGNVADQRGGGIASFEDDGSITLIHSTVTGNSAPDDQYGGIYIVAPPLRSAADLIVQNSIIAGNSATAHPNCGIADLTSNELTYIGTNLLGDADCEPRADDIVAADPVLGPLADNGGPTRTHALLPGSPAIETAVSGCATIATDQRYVTRPQGSHCDIGAFEFTGFILPPLSVDAGGTVSSAGAALVSGRITCPAPAMLTLRVTIRQAQKIGKVNVTVEATGDMPVTCGGSVPWGIALAPATGGFRAGTGTVTARTLNGPAYLQAAEATRSVKLGWGKK